MTTRSGYKAPMVQVSRARLFAEAKHAGQMYGSLPYTQHLQSVEYVLVRFGYATTEMISAAWLHDVLEDTTTTEEELLVSFPKSVVDLVVAVTDEPGRNRKERKAATYPKIVAAGTSAVALKLADRIANVEACLPEKNKLWDMYRKEHPAFKRALCIAGQHDPMWSRLDILL